MELWIALRYVLTKNKESFISIISIFSFVGIALGVATLIVVMSVMKGYEIQLVDRILGLNGHLLISSDDPTFDYNVLISKISQNPNVKFAAPLLEQQAMAFGKDKKANISGIMVRGMDFRSIAQKPLLADSLRDGSWEIMEAEHCAVVGMTLAQNLKLNVGDTFKIIAPQTEMTMLGRIPRMKSYSVCAVFDVGMYEYNASTVFLPIEDARLLFTENAPIAVEIIAQNIDSIKSIKEYIRDTATTTLYVSDWMASNKVLLNALAVERNVMFLILTLIIIVAIFNIISGLIMLVKDKTRSIAILRTVGMSRGSVIRIFMFTGAMIGVLGTILGLVLGTAFALNINTIKEFLERMYGIKLFDPIIYFLTTLPVELEIDTLFVVGSMSFLLSCLATIYPAWKASKLMPAEALRYE